MQNSKIKTVQLFWLILLTLFLIVIKTEAQDTFSIVAIDSVTGEIGSAGASCVGSSATYPHGAQILSDVIPGVGAIHTQASWDQTNQQNAHNWMMMGLAPQQIIDSLVAHDASGNPSIRQYGIADYNGGHPRSGAYTGSNCSNYKNDTAHLNYSIQGNILMGQQILDSMQTRFLTTQGTLADRLMAALQGAKVIGADTRCAVHNTSSQSSFLRVAKMTDPYDTLYLDLWMAYPTNYPGVFPVDPIDSLQTLYNIWKASVGIHNKGLFSPDFVKVYNSAPGNAVFDFTLCRNWQNLQITIFDILGRILQRKPVSSRIMQINIPESVHEGILIYQVTRPDGNKIAKGKFFIQ